MSRTLVTCIAVVQLFSAARSDEATVRKLMAQDLEERMRGDPTWATARGDRRFDTLLPDAGSDARARRLKNAQARLDELRALKSTSLDAELLAYELELRLAAARYKTWQMPVNQIGGPQQWLPQLVADTSFRTKKHFADYIARLERIPAYLAQVEANLRAGLAAGRTPPRVTLGEAATQALANGTKDQEKDPTLHPLWPPFGKKHTDGDVPPRARRVIARDVVPAFRRFGTFLRDEYIPKCRTTIAAGALPAGEAFYRFELRRHTTLDSSPDEIHRLGLAEIKRIRAEMMKVIERAGFARKNARGEPLAGDELFRAFTTFLRTDPRFFYKDKAELLAGYRDIAKRIDAFMPRLFRRLPRLAYGVKEMPPFIARSAPTAYYYRGSLKEGRPGWFVANTFRLDQRPKYEMIPLTLHEAVPGHHHQYALAGELEGLADWRRINSYTAFGEGWALYAERLGREMDDLLKDPYDDFGGLSYEMWRALRLVVDTGLHAQGWTRKRAIDYMLQNSALTRRNVQSEVDRYIAWPGQATAYKIGELRIRALRATAEKQLGERFDLRAFHDMLLEQGSIPLPVLERRAKRWIGARQERSK